MYPADQRRIHELMFTHANLTYFYHQQSRVFESTEKDYLVCLESLPHDMLKEMQKRN